MVLFTRHPSDAGISINVPDRWKITVILAIGYGEEKLFHFG
jgi:hypothetical protein